MEISFFFASLKQNSIGKMAKTIAPVATITTTTTTKSVQNNQVGNGVQTKPKDVIEVKLNAKNFFGEGFKDEVVKEIRYLANTIIESKKSKLSDVVHTHNSTIGSMTYPRSVSKLANDEPKKNHTTKSVANKLATPTAAASKGSLPTVYENGKGSSEQLESKRPKTKIVSKINSFRSGSIAGNRTNETRLESQKNSLRSGFVKESKFDSAKNSTKSGSLSAKIKSQTDLLINVRPATMKITRPAPLTTTSNKSTTHRQFSTKINNSRTCSSIELPKMNTKINQTSYTSLRNVPVKESSRMKRISTAASAINKAETKPNVEKMSIDNLCCENNNSNLNKNGNDESAKEVGVVDGGSIPVADRSAPAATPLTTSKSFRKNQTNCDNSIDMTTTKTTAIGGVQNESIKKISGVEKEVLSGSNQSEEMTSVKQLRKPHFFKKLIKLARKN